MLNGGAMDSAHMALDSDCFSNATAMTRRCCPGLHRRLVATDGPVAPPTDPAVCTRSSGLPVAPNASVRYSSGIITPSNRSGAFPTTTASMSASARKPGVRHRAVRRLPAQPRDRHVGARLGPVPGLPRPHPGPPRAASMTPPRTGRTPGSAAAARLAGRVPERAPGPAGHDRPRRQPDPRQPGGEHRIAAQRAARRVDRDVLAEPERPPQQELLMRKRRVQLC